MSYRFWAIQTGSLYLMMSPMIPPSDKGGNKSTKISGYNEKSDGLVSAHH